MAVQLDRLNPVLKAPGVKRLKLKCDKLLSNFAFNLNLRRCTLGERLHFAGEATMRQHPVGRCRLTVSKPALKAPMVSALETRML